MLRIHYLKNILILTFCLTVGFTCIAQKESIKWVSFEEAVALNEKNPKKFIIDVYTKWCGWCKKMDANTFTHPVIVEYINANYWPVKLDAEQIDTVRYGTQIFVNEKTSARRSTHQLAIALLNGKMTYPSIVYLDENVELMHPAIAGYQTPKNLERIIRYFGEEAHKSIPWDEYQKNFKSNIKSNIKSKLD